MRTLILQSFLVMILSTGLSYGAQMDGLEENLKRQVMVLSARIGERNYVYYDALNEAANYIAAEFERYGYEPEIQKYDIGDRTYKNIIAIKKGEFKKEEIIIVGAHYDSVLGSPGANDNGSGVSVLLELSRLFSEVKTERTVKFIAFSNEEPPFYLSANMGSRVYAKDARKRREDIKAMISLETIGYFSEEPNSQSYPLWFGLLYPDKANFIGVISNLGSRRLIRKIEGAFKRNSEFNIIAIAAPAFVSGVNFSDHDSFWKYGYQACMVTDTAFYRYPFYHTQGDTFEKVDYRKLAEVAKGLYYAILELAGRENHISNPGSSNINSGIIVPIGEIDRSFLEDLSTPRWSRP